jgi:hypothetical protein
MRGTRARDRRGRRALIALLVAACGPYADVAQKLDVTTSITDGETWVSAQGTEVRVLVLGRLAGGGPADFSFTAMQMPISAGVSATALQGQWTEDPQGGTATFTARHAYLLPDERSTSLLSRTGVTRDEVSRTLQLAASRSNGRLTLAGDPALAGMYVPFQEALARLGATTERDAACAFQVANLAIRATEVRIIGFGGPGMTQYQTATVFVGTLGGTFRVSEQGFFDNTTTITYSALEELGGSRVDGPQITSANASGNGHMSGVLSFVLLPRPSEGAPLPPIAGSIDYGEGGDPADAVQISNGSASGGHYAIALEGGGSARVSPVTAPSPSVAECLALP